MEQSNTYKTTRLNKGNLPIEEIRILLNYWKPDERITDYANRLRHDGIIDKKTATWTFGLVRMFKGWFESPDDLAARRLQVLVKNGINNQNLSELVFLYKSRTEMILKDFAVEKFWPAVHNGDIYLPGQTVYEFIHAKQESGKLNKELTESTVIHLARAITGSLKNAGFLEERRGMHELIPYRLCDLSMTYLAYDLHLNGLSDNALVECSDWLTFGMNRSQVVERLSDLGKQSGMVVQHAGSVVRITWLYSTMEEVLDACTR